MTSIMEMFKGVVLLSIFIQASLLPMITLAADADPLQDFCVADENNAVTINGFVCKKAVTAQDFVLQNSGLNKVGTITNGIAVTPIFVQQFPALNTLGVSLVRFDFAQGGLNPPHVHPRASELFVLLEGTMYVGFLDTSSSPNLFAVTMKAGDAFVFPKGLVHFQFNVGKGTAFGISGLSSQNPGVQQIAKSLFASNPSIDDAVLEKAFMLNQKEVDYIKSKLTA